MLFPVDKILWLNIAVLAILLLSIYSGYRDGFIVKALGCIGFILIGIVSWMAAPVVAAKLDLFPRDVIPLSAAFLAPYVYDTLNKFTVFIVLFVVLSFLILLIKPICSEISAIPIIAEVNKLLGVLFGLLQGVILLVVVTLIFRAPLFVNGTDVIEHSVLKTTNTLTESIMFFMEDPMAQWQSIQKLLTPSAQLNQDDIDKIVEWLKSQELSEQQIQEFLSELRN